VAPMGPELIQKAGREVLETTAGANVVRSGTCAPPDGHFAGVMATVSLSGDRGGTLVIFCDRALAAGVTNAMLGMDGDDPGDETIVDAMGELANQVGGTLKRALGADGSDMMLSVPVVAASASISHHVKATATPTCVEIELPEGVVRICLWPG